MGSTTVRAGSAAFRAALRRKLASCRAIVAGVDPVVLLLVLAAGAVAFAAHAAYRENLRPRWSSTYHDRNAHYQAGINVACELRCGHLVQAARDLDAASMVWPALHPAFLAAILTVLGPSPEAAVLPGLFGWCGATVFAFLISRRLGGTHGATGGLVTAALFLGSPALQALATDVMLESLGLCLTLATLYAYLAFVEKPTRGTGIALGLALSAIFLHKYNYWVLVVVALGGTELLRRPQEWFALLRNAIRMVDWSAWLRDQFKRPLNYIIAALLGISLVAWLNGGIALTWFQLHDPRLYVSTAYSLFLLRLAIWWWPTGRLAANTLCGEPGAKVMAYAAILPLVWLLLPFRLKTFFWFSSPANTIPGLEHSFADGFLYYLDGFVDEYHTAGTLAIIAAAFATIGLVALLLKRGIPGRLALPVAFFLSCALASLHPNQQLRFLHTWAPILWVAAGVGVAALLGLLARVAGERAGRVAGVAVVSGLTASLFQLTPAFSHVSPAFGRGYDPTDASLRDLYGAYLPLLDGNEPTAIFCNRPDASWSWAFMENFGHKNGLKHNMRDADAFDPVIPEGAAKWVASTDCRTVVYVEIPPTSPLFEPNLIAADNSAILAAMKASPEFHLERRIRVKNLGTVWVWKR
jgi:Dolichyl-phosphate-mannose-protein mannosyltransferase